MRRSVLLAVLLAVPPTSPADEPTPPVAVPLTLSPVAAPDPALKYEFAFRLKDRTPGNAAVGYHRAIHSYNADEGKPKADTLDGWLAAPADRFPAREVKEYLARPPVAGSLRELGIAARSSYCDWELADRLRAEGLGVRLPEFEAARDLGKLLALKARADLAENRFEDAVHTLRVGFQFARHVGEAPCQITLLVGTAITHMMIERVQELIQRPGAPNLYWALSALPRPLINPRPAFDGEELIIRATYPMIARFEKGPVSEDRADAQVARFFRLAEMLADGKPEERNERMAREALKQAVAKQEARARKALVARGRTAGDVERMPASQAVFLHAWHRYQDVSDEMVKWMTQPIPAARPGLAAAERQLIRARTGVLVEADLFLAPFMLVHPAYRQVLSAHIYRERRLAALRAVEALRLHAASWGNWPKSLAEVTRVPVPDDPLTGKPFGYAVRNGVASVTAPPPEGEPPSRSNNFRYELRVRAAK